MKRLIQKTLFSSLFFTSFSLNTTEVLTEIKGAYFRPTDQTFRDIYGSAQALYTLELSPQLWKDLYAFTSGSFLYQTGHSTGDGSESTFYCIPIGTGLKYFYPIKWIDIYAGAGALAVYTHTKNDSPYVIREISKWGYGGIFKLGALFNKNSFFLDLFADYSIIHIPFSDTRNGTIVPKNGDLSGFSIGAGIGYRFGYKSIESRCCTIPHVDNNVQADNEI